MMAHDLRLALLVMEQRHREAEQYALGQEQAVGRRRLDPGWLHRAGGVLILAGQRLQQDKALQA